MLLRRSPCLPRHRPAELELQPPLRPRVPARAQPVRRGGGTTFPSSTLRGAVVYAHGRAAQIYEGGAGAARGCGQRAELWPVSGGARGVAVGSSRASPHPPPPRAFPPAPGVPAPTGDVAKRGRREVKPAPLAEPRPPAPGFRRAEGSLRSVAFPARPGALGGATAAGPAVSPLDPDSCLTVGGATGAGLRAGCCPGQCSPESAVLGAASEPFGGVK